MRTLSPLRYPGGKTAIRILIKQYVENNGPINNFVEPFAGGSGVSLWLLFNRYINKVYINDFDFLIYKIWDAILNDTNNFINKLVQSPVTIEEWHKQKAIIEDENEYINRSPLDIGFAAFFLNRCNRSGIITKVAGPIGGKKQTGKWKLDARFNKTTLIKKIIEIANHKDNIYLSNQDAIVFMEQLTIPVEETFFYLDPPYYLIGSELYRNYYNDIDHIKLRDFMVSKKNFKWLISYDNTEFIREIYRDQKIQEVAINHQAHIQHSSSEIIITPQNILDTKLAY
jgi:DNA adenine methylase